MKSTIGAAGRIVISTARRERPWPRPGGVIEIRAREGHREIEPARSPMQLVKRRGGGVAIASRALPVLTGEILRQTIGRTRR